uniref:Uncharacterized protein n=1 Tax=viral metagenome TaxID=1070528 RepID=A0A6M3KTM5_9ZZZZ
MDKYSVVGPHYDGTVISSAVTLTPPAGAHGIRMQALTQNVRYTLDGTVPTATTGFQLKAADAAIVVPLSTSMSIKVIEETATADIQYQWLG